MSLAYLGINLSDDEAFDLALVKNPMVLVAWGLLALLPRWKHSISIARLVGILFAVLYVLIIVDALVYHPADIAAITNGKYKTTFDLFWSLEGIHILFSSKSACFGGWVHYAVFDLWTGIWITQDSIEYGFPQLLLIPVLFFTLMLGPCGLLLYFFLRTLLVSVGLIGAKPQIRKID